MTGDRQLVVDRQGQPLALRPVAQRRVVDVEGIGGTGLGAVMRDCHRSSENNEPLRPGGTKG